jgi:hypothetical protein
MPTEQVVTASLKLLCMNHKQATFILWFEINLVKKRIFCSKPLTLFGKYTTTTEEPQHMATWTVTKRSLDLTKPPTIDQWWLENTELAICFGDQNTPW